MRDRLQSSRGLCRVQRICMVAGQVIASTCSAIVVFIERSLFTASTAKPLSACSGTCLPAQVRVHVGSGRVGAFNELGTSSCRKASLCQPSIEVAWPSTKTMSTASSGCRVIGNRSVAHSVSRRFHQCLLRNAPCLAGPVGLVGQRSVPLFAEQMVQADAFATVTRLACASRAPVARAA